MEEAEAAMRLLLRLLKKVAAVERPPTKALREPPGWEPSMAEKVAEVGLMLTMEGLMLTMEGEKETSNSTAAAMAGHRFEHCSMPPLEAFPKRKDLSAAAATASKIGILEWL